MTALPIQPAPQAMRLTLKLGGRTRKLLLVGPPFPFVGDTMRLDDEQTWTVTKTAKEKILAVFKRDGKGLRMVAGETDPAVQSPAPVAAQPTTGTHGGRS